MSLPRGPVRRGAAALLVAAAVVLAAAGCGGGPDRSADRSYVEAVNAAQNDFADRFDRLSSRITPTSTPRQDRRTLAQFQVAVDRVVRRLRAARPPERVRALHARLIAEISGYRAQIGAARRAFASRDPQRVLAAQGRLVGAVNETGARVNRTIDDINRRLRDG